MDREIKRGDMYLASFGGIGSEQTGRRPVLVIQNDVGNRHSRTVIVAMITSRISTKAKLPTHSKIKAQGGLTVDSIVLMEQIRTIDKRRLKTHIGTISGRAVRKLDCALAVSVGLAVVKGVRYERKG